MYQVRREEERGPFGILKRKTPVGWLNEAAKEAQVGLANGLHISFKDGTLIIKSTVPDLFRVDFKAQPQMRRPKEVALLSPDRPEVRTGRSHVTITSLREGAREKIVIEGPEPKPLILTDREVRALQMGVKIMEGNVRDAHDQGFKKGLDEGYFQGSQPHPTNL